MRFSGFSVKGPGKTRMYFSNSGKKRESRAHSSGSGAGRKWRIGIGVFFILGFIGELMQDEKDVGLAIFCLLLGLVLVFWPLILLGLSELRSRHAASATSQAETSAETYRPVRISDTSHFYEHVGLYRPEGVCAAMPALGTALMFKAQPDNQYDAEAIYAESNGGNVGYLNKGKLRDFVADALENCWCIYTTVTRADDRLEASVEIDKQS